MHSRRPHLHAFRLKRFVPARYRPRPHEPAFSLVASAPRRRGYRGLLRVLDDVDRRRRRVHGHRRRGRHGCRAAVERRHSSGRRCSNAERRRANTCDRRGLTEQHRGALHVHGRHRELRPLLHERERLSKQLPHRRLRLRAELQQGHEDVQLPRGQVLRPERWLRRALRVHATRPWRRPLSSGFRPRRPRASLDRARWTERARRSSLRRTRGDSRAE